MIPATESAKLHHNVRESARKVESVPAMKQYTFISESKFAEAGYLTVFDAEEVNNYDAMVMKVEMKKKVIIKCWQDPESGLFRSCRKKQERIRTHASCC